MTVAELLHKLESFPPEMDVWISGDGPATGVRTAGRALEEYIVIDAAEDEDFPGPKEED